MPTAALITLGCKVNQYDTQAMQEIILRNGYTVVGEKDPADCLLYTSPSPRDRTRSRMPSSA